MIYNALNTIGIKLNEFLKSKFSSTDNHLEMSNLLEQSGNLAITDPNKVIATLINIERETAMGIQPRIEKNPDGRFTQLNPPIFINIYLLFTSIYTGKNYPEGLKFLSAIIEYLQGNSLLDHNNTPQLSDKIDKLTFEIINLDIQSLSQLWGAIGGKYMPSVLYKIRMLTMDSSIIKTELHAVKEPDLITNT